MNREIYVNFTADYTLSLIILSIISVQQYFTPGQNPACNVPWRDDYSTNQQSQYFGEKIVRCLLFTDMCAELHDNCNFPSNLNFFVTKEPLEIYLIARIFTNSNYFRILVVVAKCLLSMSTSALFLCYLIGCICNIPKLYA